MKFLGLFEGYGIELEYMIVDQQSLNIRTISDEILRDAAGEIASDFEDGDVTWSNELVLHVIELKTTGPAATLGDLESRFSRSLTKMRTILAARGARLMPTAMHPWMSPAEMKLWPHDYNEIYEIYDKVFGCEGHGWCNLQSVHINLPFRDDAEFERLHTAIRLVLPLLPALAASSPVVEGRPNGTKDNRLLYYQKNQAKVPSITGMVIPEPVRSRLEYDQNILQRIYSDIALHDPNGLLQDDWLNSRGAIARFERQTIEIRVLDIQEAPSMDIAIADFTVALLKTLIDRSEEERQFHRELSSESLKSIFDSCVSSAESTVIDDPLYLRCWKTPESQCRASDLFAWLLELPEVQAKMSRSHVQKIRALLSAGTLASRIERALGPDPNRALLKSVYGKLCDCLDRDEMFLSDDSVTTNPESQCQPNAKPQA